MATPINVAGAYLTLSLRAAAFARQYPVALHETTGLPTSLP